MVANDGNELETPGTTNARGQIGAHGFDYERYRTWLDEELGECELTEQQARELLSTLWEIMSSFAALGFNADPAQLVCGLVGETLESSGTPYKLCEDQEQEITAAFLRAAERSHS